jgi:hypothetical protein
VFFLLKNMIENPSYPMLVESHEHLHPFVTLNKNFANHDFFNIKIAIWIFLNRLQTQVN